MPSSGIRRARRAAPVLLLLWACDKLLPNARPPGQGLPTPLPEPEVLGRDFEQLIFGKKVERLLQALLRRRRETHRDVGRLGAYVRLLLFSADVDPDVARPLLNTDDHALVDLFARLDEGDSALLRAG